MLKLGLYIPALIGNLAC